MAAKRRKTAASLIKILLREQPNNSSRKDARLQQGHGLFLLSFSFCASCAFLRPQKLPRQYKVKLASVPKGTEACVFLVLVFL